MEREHRALPTLLLYLLLTLFPQLGIQRHLRLMSLHLHLDHLRLAIPLCPDTLRRQKRNTVKPDPPCQASIEARNADICCPHLHHHYYLFTSPPLPPYHQALTTSPLIATWAPLGYRAAGIRMRAAAASPPLSLPSNYPYRN
ncbi:hypothetical protein Tco_0971677 [Tanacetum coccineum]